MGDTKTQVEQTTRTTNADVEKQQATPEAHQAPQSAQGQEAGSPPAGPAFLAQVSNVINDLPETTQAPAQAKRSTSLQQKVGNARMLRMMAGPQTELPNQAANEQGESNTNQNNGEQKVADIAKNSNNGLSSTPSSQQGQGEQEQTATNDEKQTGHEQTNQNPPSAAEQQSDEANSVGRQTDTASVTPAGRGEPLPASVQARMESAFDHDFSHVRIHTDNDATKAASNQNAHAYTVGADISFAEGEFAPESAAGERLLAHELAHVVQQDEGRMPSGGTLTPEHQLEKEAYAREKEVTATLPVTDQPSAPQSSQTSTSQYQGEPTIARSSNGETPANSPRRGPNTTEAALMGPLPSAEEARAEATTTTGESEANQQANEPTQDETTLLVEAQTSPATDSAPQQAVANETARPDLQTQANTDAESNRTSTPSAGQEATPSLSGPDAWLEALNREGGLRIDALQASAAASIQRIRTQVESATIQAQTAFATARENFASTTQATLASITEQKNQGAQSIQADIATQASELDTYFTTRADDVRTTVETARTRLDQCVESEANRSINESETRAGRAHALAENTGSAEEAPIAEGQQEIANRIAGEVAEHCRQTGREAAAEVRKSGESRREGIGTNLEQVQQTLESARVAAQTKLATTESEALASLDEQAALTSAEVEARNAEGMTALNEQQTAFGTWAQQQAGQQYAEIATRAEQGSADLAANFSVLNESFSSAASEAAPLFTEAADDPGIAMAQQVFNQEMANAWSMHVAPQLAEGDRICASFEEYVGGVEQGIATVSAETFANLEQTTSETTTGLTTLGERFSQFAESATEQTSQLVQEGIGATHNEADRAVAEHSSAVTAEIDEAVQAIQSAVDQQLAWEDGQIAKAESEISTGQTQAAQQYRSLEAQARERDAGGAASAIARGWLGEVWDWFSDLAEGTLEWFQEKLGETWGNIIGHILRGIIYVVGVVAVAALWVGAQVINIIWGFLWGETAIPGYGGGFIAFVFDVVAGVLIYGDIRDLFKYAIWRPLWGEGPWWLNVAMIVVTLIGLIPVGGDIFKAIVKGAKKGGKGSIKLLIMIFGEELVERIMRKLGMEVAEGLAERLGREVGEELAERMIRELGEEGAEELFERLGKEAIKQLGEELTPTVIKRLADELGERTLKRLAEKLGGNVVETLSTDLGRESLEKLLRTVGPEVIEELHTHLGKDALQNLLKGLRGVTVKEYFDALGGPALRRLGADLEGYAVKELFDDLGADVLGKLAVEMSGETVQRLANDLGTQVLKDLTGAFGGRGVKELAEDLSTDSIKRLVEEFTAVGLKQLHDDLGRALFKEFTTEFSASSLKRLIDKLGAQTARELAEAIGVKEIRTLTQKFGYEGLGELVTEIGVQGIKDIGVKALKKLAGSLNPKEIGEWFVDLGAVEFRRLAETYGGKALRHYGRNWFKAYKGVSAQTQHHLLVGEFNAAGHLRSGLHDKTAFDGVVTAGNAVIDAAQTRVSGIYTEYMWRRPTQAVTTLNPKTVVDNLAGDWATWADRIRRATDELIKKRRFPENPGAIPETTISNVSWTGYFRNDEIATFFPTI